jgi:hypothetical protein
MSTTKSLGTAKSIDFAQILQEAFEEGQSVDATLGDLMGEITRKLELLVREE